MWQLNPRGSVQLLCSRQWTKHGGHSLGSQRDAPNDLGGEATKDGVWAGYKCTFGHCFNCKDLLASEKTLCGWSGPSLCPFQFAQGRPHVETAPCLTEPCTAVSVSCCFSYWSRQSASCLFVSFLPLFLEHVSGHHQWHLFRSQGGAFKPEGWAAALWHLEAGDEQWKLCYFLDKSWSILWKSPDYVEFTKQKQWLPPPDSPSWCT